MVIHLYFPSGPVDGYWGVWKAWSECSLPCGGGTQWRQRSCDNPAPVHGGRDCYGDKSEERQCNTEICKGKLTNPFSKHV